MDDTAPSGQPGSIHACHDSVSMPNPSSCRSAQPERDRDGCGQGTDAREPRGLVATCLSAYAFNRSTRRGDRPSAFGGRRRRVTRFRNSAPGRARLAHLYHQEPRLGRNRAFVLGQGRMDSRFCRNDATELLHEVEESGIHGCAFPEHARHVIAKRPCVRQYPGGPGGTGPLGASAPCASCCSSPRSGGQNTLTRWRLDSAVTRWRSFGPTL